MTFCLYKDTFCVNIENPFTGEVDKKIVFFGILPKDIKSKIAKRNFEPAAMSEYFGKSWKEKLHLQRRVKSIKAKLATAKYKGAADSEVDADDADNSDESESDNEFDFDFEDIDKLKEKVQKQEVTKLEDSKLKEKITYVTDYTIYPESTIWDIKQKIYLISGIPVYRIALFNRSDDKLRFSHKLYIDDIEYAINTVNDKEDFYKIKLDGNLYNNRDNLMVRMKETYKMIDYWMTEDLYMWDLEYYKNELNENINIILESKYLSEKLFYGTFKKYFPIFDINMMKLYFNNEELLNAEYIYINKPKHELEDQFTAEKEILDKVYNNVDEFYEKYDSEIDLCITKIDYKSLDSYNIKDGLFIRNMMNLFTCGNLYVSLEMYITRDNIKYKISKYSVGQSEEYIEKIFGDLEYFVFDKLVITFIDEKYKFNNQFEINSNASYIVRANYNKADIISFSDSIEYIGNYVNAIIDTINLNKKYVFNPNYTFDSLPNFSMNTVKINNVKFTFRWNKLITRENFDLIYEKLNKYYNAKIFEPHKRSVILANIINIRVIKGFIPNIKYLKFKKGKEAQDYYVVFRDINFATIWNTRFGGKNIDIENNITNLSFNIDNVNDVEFIMFSKYLLMFIDELNSSMSSKKTKVVVEQRNVKKKMKELDPLLYNFRDDKGNKYSRICQKKFRPVGVYNQEEYNAMPEDEKNKLFKFINYTTSEPIYYKCPKCCPYMGFITGKHPDGLCIPKCKASDTSGKKNIQIKKQCMENYSFQGKSASSDNMLKFGKKLSYGKYGYLHDSIYDIFYTIEKDDFYIMGVKQSYNNIEGSNLLICYSEIVSKSPLDILKEIKTHIATLQYNNTSLYNILPYKELQVLLYELIEKLPISIHNIENIITELLYVVYGVSVVLFNTNVHTNNELLTNTNSNISIIMTKNTKANIANKNNIRLIMVLKLYDEVYPIFYGQEGIYTNESEVISLFAKGFSQKTLITDDKDQKKYCAFTYNNLKSKVPKYTKYVSGNNIRYLVNGNICIGVYNSFNKTDGSPENYMPFDRNSGKYEFANLAKLLISISKIVPIFIILEKNPNRVYTKDDLNNANFIGLRFGEIYSWFNNTNISKIKEYYKEFYIEMINVEPYDVNMEIIKRSAPEKCYENGINETYYNFYIYNILKFEIYKVFLEFRDKKLRTKLLKYIESKDNNSIVSMLSKVKKSNKNDFYKLSNIVYNSENKKADLNITLLYHDIKIIIDNVKNIDDLEKYLDEVAKSFVILEKLDNIIDKPINNIIISHITNPEKHEENLFYRNNKLKVDENIYKKLIKNVALDIQNEILFEYEINNFTILFIINYFYFDVSSEEKISIQKI